MDDLDGGGAGCGFGVPVGGSAGGDVARAGAEAGIVVEGSDGTNTLGLVLRRDRGVATVEGAEASAKALRVVAPSRAQPTL